MNGTLNAQLGSNLRKSFLLAVNVSQVEVKLRNMLITIATRLQHHCFRCTVVIGCMGCHHEHSVFTQTICAAA